MTAVPIEHEPTKHRRQHGGLERVDKQIVDAHGAIGNPWRTIGLLAKWERAKRITPEMRAAGEKFHELFQLAALDPIQAADMGRIANCGRADKHRGSVQAREEVGEAIGALGGHRAQGASCAWYVLGCEHSLTQWVLRQGWGGNRASAVHEAKGMLIGALDVLVRHYGY